MSQQGSCVGFNLFHQGGLARTEGRETGLLGALKKSVLFCWWFPLVFRSRGEGVSLEEAIRYQILPGGVRCLGTILGLFPVD